jgi:hypothetical protein
MELGLEKIMHIQNIGSCLRVSETQIPSIWKIYKEACDILEINPPDLFIENSPFSNACTYGYTNPFVQLLIEHLANSNTEYLLPARTRFTGEINRTHHTSRSTVYRKLQEVDKTLFPHLLRGWCAGMLVEVYGFDMFDLQGWFSWKSATTPSFYARTREKELKAKLGIEEAPKRE